MSTFFRHIDKNPGFPTEVANNEIAVINSKSETNSNDKNSKPQTGEVHKVIVVISCNTMQVEPVLFLSFAHSNFEFVSNFDIRISCLIDM
jgi:hypothetical protein